jgi:thiol:disulfide interchange protein DsbA
MTKGFVTYTFFLFALAFQPVQANTDMGIVEGVEYKKVPNPQSIAPHKKSVVEVFYYGCSHCYNLEPSLHKWLETKPKDVHFERMPAVLNNPNWVFMARVYYTAKLLGIETQFHNRYFDAIQRDRKPIFNVDALAKFVEPMGVKPEDYKKMFNSFQVNSAIAKAKQKTQDYGIDGVPAVIVNGKYLTDVPMASSREGLWKVVNTLVNK